MKRCGLFVILASLTLFNMSAWAAQLTTATSTANAGGSACQSFIFTIPWQAFGNYYDDSDNRCNDYTPAGSFSGSSPTCGNNYHLYHTLAFKATALGTGATLTGVTTNPETNTWGQNGAVNPSRFSNNPGGATVSPGGLPSGTMFQYPLCQGSWYFAANFTVYNTIDEYQVVYGLLYVNTNGSFNMVVNSGQITTNDCCAAYNATGGGTGTWMNNGMAFTTGNDNLYSVGTATYKTYMQLYSFDFNSHHDDMVYWISGAGFALYIGG